MKGLTKIFLGTVLIFGGSYLAFKGSKLVFKTLVKAATDGVVVIEF